MIRKQFLEDVESGKVKLPRTIPLSRLLKKIAKFEEDEEKSIDSDFTRQEYIELLTYLKVKSSTSFANTKPLLVGYIKYLYEHGVVSQDSLDAISSLTYEDFDAPDDRNLFFFKDINALQNAIQEVLGVSDCYDVHTHDCVIALIYLAWFGFGVEEATSIKKNEVLKNGIVHDDVLTIMPDFVMDHMRYLKKSAGYYHFGKGEFLREYADSEYLIRSNDNAQLNESQVRNALSRFNRILDRKYSFSYNFIQRSGLYYRIYISEQNTGNIDFENYDEVAEIFHVEFKEAITHSDAVANRIKLKRIEKEYKKYKELHN